MWSVTPAWVMAAYISTALMILWHWSTILFTGVYQRILYPGHLKKRYDPDFVPHCTIIIPCKGIPPRAKSNLRAFLRQDYPRYNVVFAVESEDDPAVPIIKSLMAENDGASLVVAGLASACAQKVHNLIAGLQFADSSEVLVFADNDIGPASKWLRRLVLPLSDPTVSITTGYRWLRGRNGSIGELAHNHTSIFIYVAFTWLAYWHGLGLWGGTMAMRKKDFEEAEVEQKWKESVVDDISLSQIAVQNGLKSVLVPLCITPSDNVLNTFGSFTDWVARQLLYVKAYHPLLWFGCLIMVFCAFSIYALLPISIAGALFTPLTFWEWGGGAPLVLVVGEMLTVVFYAALHPVPYLLKFALLAPVLRLGQLIGCFKTIGTRTISWSGVRYTFDRNGKVVRVER